VNLQFVIICIFEKKMSEAIFNQNLIDKNLDKTHSNGTVECFVFLMAVK